MSDCLALDADAIRCEAVERMARLICRSAWYLHDAKIDIDPVLGNVRKLPQLVRYARCPSMIYSVARSGWTSPDPVVLSNSGTARIINRAHDTASASFFSAALDRNHGYATDIVKALLSGSLEFEDDTEQQHAVWYLAHQVFPLAWYFRLNTGQWQVEAYDTTFAWTRRSYNRAQRTMVIGTSWRVDTREQARNLSEALVGLIVRCPQTGMFYRRLLVHTGWELSAQRNGGNLYC